MITTKQRANLRGMANGIDTILQVGKTGLTENLLKQIADALKARELIKLRTLDTCPLSSKEAARTLSEQTKSEVVQVIGSRFVLYKKNPELKDKSIVI